jgi:hypothetical protein
MQKYYLLLILEPKSCIYTKCKVAACLTIGIEFDDPAVDASTGMLPKRRNAATVAPVK